MDKSNKLKMSDTLPLTCSRTGTCCHGKNVNLNPWELAHLAHAKGISTREFRDTFCNFGGNLLKFDAAPGWKNLPACSQYIPDFGCSVHTGRPLPCRLYPLGRQRQGEQIDYIFQGKTFPCLEGCPEVVDLPFLTVAEYIDGQQAQIFEAAEDEYLELMQNLADVAFTLLLETGLAQKDNGKTLQLWHEVGNYTPAKLVTFIGDQWIDLLMITELQDHLDNHKVFFNNHYEVIEVKVQEACNSLNNIAELTATSGLLIGLALYLGRGLGVNINDLINHWINIAKQNGATN